MDPTDFQNGKGGVDQTVAAAMASWGEEAARLARGRYWLHNLLPEGLQRDLFSGDEDEVALTFLDIVEPLQYPLSVMQKARRHALASPLLVTSGERLTPNAIAEATNVETADPACSARFGTPSFVCFDCSQPSIFESASHQPTLANRRFEFSCQ